MLEESCALRKVALAGGCNVADSVPRFNDGDDLSQLTNLRLGRKLQRDRQGTGALSRLAISLQVPEPGGSCALLDVAIRT
ncbi:MAG: hypothetical protein ACXWM1_07080, partial [Candidatus Binataceae bacterium]